MTLKLVSDNGELADVAATALADEVAALAANLVGATSVVAIVMGGDCPIRVMGEDLTDHELIGIFEAAKFDVLRDILEGE